MIDTSKGQELTEKDWNKLVDLCTEFMNGKVEK